MPDSSGLFVGQVGAVISIETGEDAAVLAAATTTEIWYRKPSGTAGKWTASVSSTALTFTTLAASLDEPGDWVLQVYLAGVGYKAPGDFVTMRVATPLQTIP